MSGVGKCGDRDFQFRFGVVSFGVKDGGDVVSGGQGASVTGTVWSLLQVVVLGVDYGELGLDVMGLREDD